MTEKKILDKIIANVTEAIESYSLLPVNLKRLRLAKGMTQEELGKKVGISYEVIHLYETGYYDPPEVYLNKLAAVLGCSVEYFFLQDTAWEDRYTLCHCCKNLYGGSICDGNRPFPGSVTEKKVTKHEGKDIVSYKVLSCPLFERGRLSRANEKYLKTANHY
jgi:DNA-binding XRE family transcriptional regulator